MEPVIALISLTTGCLVLGRFGPERLSHWAVALRVGVSGMFVMTGLAHFFIQREELIQMVPPALPAAAMLVLLTGFLELAGAAGLWFHQTRAWAARGLSAMLLAMFPANVYYALTSTNLPFEDRLLPRTIMQLVFVTATLVLLINERSRVQNKPRFKQRLNLNKRAKGTRQDSSLAKASRP